ncbi:citryl-CoA lyase [Lentzea sp. NPDC051838]|uniref:citryl-CoA lyase n=1 Tax=Lentzea sp. NPDC051838 TaxID=3154849 RepID=UPI00342933CF
MTTASQWWRTALVRIQPGEIALRGYPIEQLIGEISFAQTIWLLLRGELPSPAQAKLLEAALVAAVDHGPQAPSIAAARMAATCGVGLNNAVATGVNLLGDVHGGAGQQAMSMLRDLRDSDLPLPKAIEEYRRWHRFLPGFGHRFHPRDPRRDPLLRLVTEAVEDEVVSGEYLVIALEVEHAIAPVPMNIDGATAVIYAELGFPPELARGLFVLSRSVGILAHAWEEQQSGARIKGPIPRPLLADYTGPSLRDLTQSGQSQT